MLELVCNTVSTLVGSIKKKFHRTLDWMETDDFQHPLGILIAAFIILFASGYERLAVNIELLTMLRCIEYCPVLLSLSIVWHTWLIFTAFMKFCWFFLSGEYLNPECDPMCALAIYSTFAIACTVKIVISHRWVGEIVKETSDECIEIATSPLLRSVIVAATMMIVSYLFLKAPIFTTARPFVLGAAIIEVLFLLAYIKPFLPLVTVHLFYIVFQSFFWNILMYFMVHCLADGSLEMCKGAFILATTLFAAFALRPVFVYMFWMHSGLRREPTY